MEHKYFSNRCLGAKYCGKRWDSRFCILKSIIILVYFTGNDEYTVLLI